jgi:hypothetical protein
MYVSCRFMSCSPSFSAYFPRYTPLLTHNCFFGQARDNNYLPLVQVFIKSLEASVGMIEAFEWPNDTRCTIRNNTCRVGWQTSIITCTFIYMLLFDDSLGYWCYLRGVSMHILFLSNWWPCFSSADDRCLFHLATCYCLPRCIFLSSCSRPQRQVDNCCATACTYDRFEYPRSPSSCFKW